MSNIDNYFNKLKGTKENPTSKKVGSSGLEGYFSNLKKNYDPLPNKLAQIERENEAMAAKDAKFNFKRDIGGIVKNIPGALKDVATQPFKQPIKTLQAVTAGAADVGPSIVNLGLNIAGSKKRLPSLGKAFAEAQDTQKGKDVLGSISEATKLAAGYELGQGLVGKLGVKSKLAKNILGDIVGGQLVSDEETLKGRGSQALFDSVFGLATGVPGALFKKISKASKIKAASKIKPLQIEAPRINLPEEGILKSQGLLKDKPKIKTAEIIDSPQIKKAKSFHSRADYVKNQLDNHKLAKSFKKGTIAEIPKKPTVKQLESTWNEAHGLTKPKKIKTSSVDTPVSQTTKTFRETVETATPKFKEDVVKMSKTLDDIEGFTPSQRIEQSAQFQHYLDNGQESHIIDVAKGRVKDPSLNDGAAWKLLEEKWDIELSKGDLSALNKIEDLSKTRNISKAAQTLSFSGMGEGSYGPARALQRTRDIMEQTLTKKGINVAKEIDDEIASALNGVREGKSLMKVLDDLIDKITCK